MSASLYHTLPTRKHLRLLSLQPLSSGPDISALIKTAEIDSLPEYEALPYVWGDVNDIREVICNGSTFTVTASLYSALQHLRHSDEARKMWVDALCINQSDVEERSTQVALMREIYLRADAVLVWFGPGEEYTEAAWETMERIGMLYQDTLKHEDKASDYYQRLDLPNTTMAPSTQRLSRISETSIDVLMFDHSGVCAEIARILGHSWLTRSWVVQEAACARRLSICCGKSSMPWETMRIVCCFMREQRLPKLLENAWQDANSMVLLQDTLRMGVESNGPEEDDYDPQYVDFDQCLLGVLPATRHLHATDPRDKVFAFLGLSDRENTKLTEGGAFENELAPWSAEEAELIIQCKLPLTPNYFTDVKALYCIVTKRLLGSTLFVLSHAVQSPTKAGFPSWVPDWRTRVETILLGRTEVDLQEERGGRYSNSRKYKTKYRPFRAGGHCSFRLNPETDLHVLELYGTFLDTIKELRDDLWLTDIWDVRGRLGDEEAYQNFMRRVSHFLIENYSPELAYHDSKGVSEYLDERAFRFRSSSYDPLTLASQCDSLPTTIDDLKSRLELTWPPQGYLQDYLRIQTANLRLSDSEFRPGYPGWQYLSAYISPSSRGSRGGPVCISNEQMPAVIPRGYFIFASRVRVRRKIFCTKLGYIGICPEWAEPGDSLFFAEGGDVPFVLRPVEEKHFRLISESYCHGMMSGQVEQVITKKENILLV